MSNAHYFIGIEIPEHVREHLKELQEQLQVNKYFKKVSDFEDFHITLLFLGDWGKERERQMLWTALEARLKESENFTLMLKNIGFFGKERFPRVIWADLEEQDNIFDLQEKITDEADKFGFTREKRPYRPHITLAKSYNTTEHYPVITNSLTPLLWQVKEVSLFKVLPGEKPMYKSVSKICFSV